jgi:glycosyltransferase involved in cell wall biosynthesis
LQKRKIILVFIDWFEPAYKAGGPIRSISNLVKSLNSYYDIFIFTSDRDLGDSVSMKDIVVDKWVEVDTNISVFYTTQKKQKWKVISNEIKNIRPDFIYLNSMFSKYYSIYPLLMKRFGVVEGKFILSPKGMLRPSALKFKSYKKKLFLAIFRLLNLHKLVQFHATDLAEAKNIESCFGTTTISSILDSPAPLPNQITFINKVPGSLKLLFIGRIHPIKQLHLVLESIKEHQKAITLTIVGTVENKNYWNICKDIIESFDNSNTVKIIGELTHDKILSLINENHVLTLPTMGENFSHAIYESLSSGRPVLISDQTPWRDLTGHKAGWDIANGEIHKMAIILQQAIDWPQEEYNEWVKGSRAYVESYLKRNDLISEYKKLFN